MAICILYTLSTWYVHAICIWNICHMHHKCQILICNQSSLLILCGITN